jgi:hypothetical protein
VADALGWDTARSTELVTNAATTVLGLQHDEMANLSGAGMETISAVARGDASSVAGTLGIDEVRAEGIIRTARVVAGRG